MPITAWNTLGAQARWLRRSEYHQDAGNSWNRYRPAIPATTTIKITTTVSVGTRSFAANNSGCATEGVPINDFNPSSGSNCAGDIRIIQEGSLGFWYRFYQGTKGRVQFGAQYSYVVKNAWSGNGAAYQLAALPSGPRA